MCKPHPPTASQPLAAAHTSCGPRDKSLVQTSSSSICRTKTKPAPHQDKYSNKKLLVTSATLVVTSATLVRSKTCGLSSRPVSSYLRTIMKHPSSRTTATPLEPKHELHRPKDQGPSKVKVWFGSKPLRSAGSKASSSEGPMILWEGPMSESQQPPLYCAF